MKGIFVLKRSADLQAPVQTGQVGRYFHFGCVCYAKSAGNRPSWPDRRPKKGGMRSEEKPCLNGRLKTHCLQIIPIERS